LRAKGSSSSFATQSKQNEPLEFEHIEEHSVVKEHEFTNMIVLCASCHGRKKETSNPRHINTASLRKLKQSLILLNGRYSDLERRLLEAFQDLMKGEHNQDKAILLPDTMLLLVRRLSEDGMVAIQRRKLPYSSQFSDGLEVKNGILIISLTKEGKEFVSNLISVTGI
jgi:HNH endonuclease